MKRLAWVLVFSVVSTFMAFSGSAADEGLSVGYGLAALNDEKQVGRIQGGRYYDFFQFTFLYERPFQGYKPLAVYVEPFVSYVNRPASGLDGGVYLGLKYYPLDPERKGLYVIGGTGTAYTTIKFQEQGTHMLFTLEAGAGYRFQRFFVEDVLRHYSNGGTTSPNRSVQADILSVGFYF
jgi:hypothetical protein